MFISWISVFLRITIEMGYSMEKFIFCLLFFVLFCIPFDLYHKYKYKFCNFTYKKNRACKNWMCKYFNSCYYTNANMKEKQLDNFVFYLPDIKEMKFRNESEK